jgi:hypothetical protein
LPDLGGNEYDISVTADDVSDYVHPPDFKASASASDTSQGILNDENLILSVIFTMKPLE